LRRAVIAAINRACAPSTARRLIRSCASAGPRAYLVLGARRRALGGRAAGLERAAACADERFHLVRRERVEAGGGVGENERRDALRSAQREVARDPAPERQTHEMRTRRTEAIQHAREIGAEVRERERAREVVRVAVTARVPRRGGEVRAEDAQLVVPVLAVAPDAVQEDDERSFPRDAERDSRRRSDEDRGHSAFAPESFTARPRASRSTTMNAANASGGLATRS
jgi:hypothetical protein